MTIVRKRVAFYAPGCDPHRFNFYHHLYCEEAARQAAVSGHVIEIGPIGRPARHAVEWRVSATIEGETVETRYRVLWWDDIVRRNWPRTIPGTVRAIMGGSGRALFGGVLRKTYQWSRPAAITCSLPFLLLWALIMLCVALPFSGWRLGRLAGGWGEPLGLAIGLVASAAFVWLAIRLERKFNLAWLARTIDILARDSRDRLPELEERREEFAALVGETLANGEYDEVLVVGHSLGSTIAVAIAARNLDAISASRSRFSLLTLGQTNCWLEFFPGANRFRAEIAAAATAESFDWVDFSAPPDAACFALVDPYTALGDRRTDRKNPKLLNARFHEIMSPSALARQSRNRVALHLQYVRATVVPAEYDYFAISAGPKTLAQRYDHRRSVRDFTRLRSRAMKHVR